MKREGGSKIDGFENMFEMAPGFPLEFSGRKVGVGVGAGIKAFENCGLQPDIPGALFDSDIYFKKV